MSARTPARGMRMMEWLAEVWAGTRFVQIVGCCATRPERNSLPVAFTATAESAGTGRGFMTTWWWLIRPAFTCSWPGVVSPVS